jgi:hypothetical protein
MYFELLCMFFQIRQCRAGPIIIIIQEGDPATEKYFVKTKTGSLNVIIHGKTILSNGAIFGE